MRLILICSQVTNNHLRSTNGVIHISYAHIETANSEASNVFYMRQVSYPLMVTVYHMLECSSMDILAFPSYSHSQHRGNKETAQVKYLNIDEEGGWCLFSIEVRNSYGSPFDVTLVRTQRGKHQAKWSNYVNDTSFRRIFRLLYDNHRPWISFTVCTSFLPRDCVAEFS